MVLDEQDGAGARGRCLAEPGRWAGLLLLGLGAAHDLSAGSRGCSRPGVPDHRLGRPTTAATATADITASASASATASTATATASTATATTTTAA